MSNRNRFPVLVQFLPKNDFRRKRWIRSLKKRPPPWDKGKRKETDLRVRKISDTFKRKKIDNFSKWREEMKKIGKIRSQYPAFIKSKDLAFLIGITLGDGNIQSFPRADRLIISLNAKYPILVNYVAAIMSKIFEKAAVVKKVKSSNCIRVWVYQKYISNRLGIPSGDRRKSVLDIPDWIWESNDFLTWYLKGLFEAEGSLSIHLPSCTYNFAFSNRNKQLLDNVKKGLIKLGFHPEVRDNAIRLRKKAEVECFRRLIYFREYIAG